MRIKKMMIATLALLLILPSFLIPIAANDDLETSEKNAPSTNEAGLVAAKDEVVYANLSATGRLENIYVVNIFDIAREGMIIDHGRYSLVKNLTDTSIINQAKDAVHFTAKDKFYYQGNLDGGDIPWNIDISYFLNGNKMDPQALAGEEGALQMEISTSANESVDPSFYDHFMLQVSLELNSDIFEDIHAEQATIANVGKNKQVTFTVMPGEDEKLMVQAQVNNFEFSGVQIAALPFNMPIDTPDTDSMTEDVATLSDAIKQLKDGVAKLKSGVSDLNKGVGEISSGSSEYKTNMNRLASSSEDLTSASEEIQGALEYMTSSLGEGLEDGADFSQLEEVTVVLSQLSGEMLGMVGGLTQLKDGYVEAFTMLKGAINGIPDIPEESIHALSGQKSAEIDLLIDVYMAAQGVKQLFNNDQFQLTFLSITPAIEGVTVALTEIGGTLDHLAEEFNVIVDGLDIGSSLAELENGISQLSSNYGEFHDGLLSYTDGISQLASGYSGLDEGLKQLYNGSKELENGVAELHGGTEELHDATKDMPKQMQAEIDQMLAEFDYSDYKPVSFVSNKNKQIQSVQFVIQAEGIEMKEEQVIIEEKEEERKSFWTLLLDLFR